MLKRLSALVIAGAALAACSESSQPTGVVPVPGGANQSILAELTCRVDVASSSVSCASAGPAAVAGRSSDLILGGQNSYVKLTSTNVVTTPTVSITADVTVKNLTGQPWGVDSLGALDTAAVKVFVVQPPTNPVVIANPTGTASFTASNQQYFKYSGALLGVDGILSPGETSGAINWQFTLNGAANFTFGVLIVADMPDEQGTLRWVRDTLAGPAGVEYLTSVWGTSASDVWVGGAAGGPTSLQHWTGSSWAPSPGYCSTAGKCATTGIWGTASNDVWAVGTEILHYDGVAWNFDDVPPATLRAVWGSASNNVYTGGDAGGLYRYNGTFWSQIGSGTSGLGTEPVSAIWGTSASNVYVGTADPGMASGLALHRFNGTTWSTVAGANINGVRSIWGSSANDIYVGGDFGYLRHWNGTAWSTITGLGVGGLDGFQGIWGNAANDVYAAQRDGDIWHYNGHVWTSLSNPGIGLFGIWGSGRDVFAVGFGSGVIVNNLAIRGMR